MWEAILALPKSIDYSLPMMHFAVIYCRIGLHFKDGGYGYFLELRNSEKKIISPETSWSTKDCVIDAYYFKLGYLKDSNAAAHSVDTGIS